MLLLWGLASRRQTPADALMNREDVSKHQKYSRIKLSTICSVDAINDIDAVVVAAGIVAGCWPGSCQRNSACTTAV